MSDETLTSLTADIIAAYVSKNKVGVGEVAGLISSVHEALIGLSPAQASLSGPEFAPAVSIRKSLSDPAKIISMIDGKPYSSLKSHLTRHGLTPAEYRARFGLPATYPMVAPAYAERRRAIALKLGLGRKSRVAETMAAPADVAKPVAKPRAQESAESVPSVAATAPVKAGRKRLGIATGRAAPKTHPGG